MWGGITHARHPSIRIQYSGEGASKYGDEGENEADFWHDPDISSIRECMRGPSSALSVQHTEYQGYDLAAVSSTINALALEGLPLWLKMPTRDLF